jgi:hypothetical protein
MVIDVLNALIDIMLDQMAVAFQWIHYVDNQIRQDNVLHVIQVIKFNQENALSLNHKMQIVKHSRVNNVLNVIKGSITIKMIEYVKD